MSTRGTGATGVDDVSAMERPAARTAVLGLASAVLFSLGLVVTEWAGEFGTDVDLKPFFVPYLLLSLVRFGIPTMAIGLGTALGEGVLDVFEGYELDDPVGFIGYVAGFVVFGWYLDEVAADRTAPRALAAAAVLGAFVQAVFEGLAFVIFDPAAGPAAGGVSVAGNTITHGVVLGAIPLVVLYPFVRVRFGPRSD